MICPECHHQVQKSDPYCPHCGHQFVVHLPGAGTAAGSVPVSKPLAGSMVHPTSSSVSVDQAASSAPTPSVVAPIGEPQHEAARDPFAAAMSADIAPAAPAASPFGAPLAPAVQPQVAPAVADAPVAPQQNAVAMSATKPQKSRGAKIARATIIVAVVVAVIAGAYVVGYETNFLGMGNPTPAHELPLTSSPVIVD